MSVEFPAFNLHPV